MRSSVSRQHPREEGDARDEARARENARKHETLHWVRALHAGAVRRVPLAAARGYGADLGGDLLREQAARSRVQEGSVGNKERAMSKHGESKARAWKLGVERGDSGAYPSVQKHRVERDTHMRVPSENTGRGGSLAQGWRHGEGEGWR